MVMEKNGTIVREKYSMLKMENIHTHVYYYYHYYAYYQIIYIYIINL